MDEVPVCMTDAETFDATFIFEIAIPALCSDPYVACRTTLLQNLLTRSLPTPRTVLPDNIHCSTCLCLSLSGVGGLRCFRVPSISGTAMS